jgi:hypothetical protein
MTNFFIFLKADPTQELQLPSSKPRENSQSVNRKNDDYDDKQNNNEREEDLDGNCNFLCIILVS